MASSQGDATDRRQPRLWSFSDCTFDEYNWWLEVSGRRVAIETKPLELLRELLVHGGNVVSKDELLERIWPDVTVVEASLPTAVSKLRVALGDDRLRRCVIETVSGIGYRLAVPVEVRTRGVTAPEKGAPAPHPHPTPRAVVGETRIVGGLAATVALVAVAVLFSQQPAAAPVAATPAYTTRDELNALRKLDVDAVDRMLAANWDPNKPYDKEGDGALNMLLNNCEWDPGHDQRKLLLVARTLLDGGAELGRRNSWGDTAYSIAKAKRYCGPDHPVTKMLRTLCYSGYKPLGDRCLATYELRGAPVSEHKRSEAARNRSEPAQR